MIKFSGLEEIPRTFNKPNLLFQGLQSKVDYSAVKLKKRELKSPYPELMLIRVKGYLLFSGLIYHNHYGSRNFHFNNLNMKFLSN